MPGSRGRCSWTGSVRSTLRISRSLRIRSRSRAWASTSARAGQLVELGGVDRDRVRGDEGAAPGVLDRSASTSTSAPTASTERGSSRRQRRCGSRPRRLPAGLRGSRRKHRPAARAQAAGSGQGMCTKCASRASGYSRGQPAAQRKGGSRGTTPAGRRPRRVPRSPRRRSLRSPAGSSPTPRRDGLAGEIPQLVLQEPQRGVGELVVEAVEVEAVVSDQPKPVGRAVATGLVEGAAAPRRRRRGPRPSWRWRSR